MLRVNYADVSALNDSALYRALYARTSPERQRKADRLARQKDKNLCVGASVLLDLALREFGLREAEMAYGYGENGKPYFENAPHLHFSISHSADKALVCISDRPLGCDVEKVADGNLGIAERFFRREEYEYILRGATERERTERLYRLWTLKESYLKATGRGITGGLDCFAIRIAENGIAVADGAGEKPYHFLEPALFPDFRTAVCAEAETDSAQYRPVCLTTLTG